MQMQAEALGIPAKLPRGAALSSYIRSALSFLAMTREEHAARTQRGSGAGASLPAAPLMAFDESTQSYRWLGDAQASSDAALLQLDALHFTRYASAHGGLLGGQLRGLHAPPIKAAKGGLTLPPGSAEQLAALRQHLNPYPNPSPLIPHP